MKQYLITVAFLTAWAGLCAAQPVTLKAPEAKAASVAPPATTSAAPTRPGAAGPAATQPPLMTPQQTLRIAVESLRVFLRQQPPPSGPAIARFLDERIAPLFDFRAMAEQAGGHWFRRLTEKRKAAMAEEMKRLFLTRLTEALLLYQNQEVRFLRPRISTDGREADVTMLIIDPRSYPARIDFRVVLDGSRWRVVDIAANGSRATVYYRRLLARELARRAWQRRQAVPPPIIPAPMSPVSRTGGRPPAAPPRPISPAH